MVFVLFEVAALEDVLVGAVDDLEYAVSRTPEMDIDNQQCAGDSLHR